MADCPQFVMWNPVPAGSTLKAKSSSDGDDYNSGVRVVGEDGTGSQWVRNDLDPGPASLALNSQGYAARGTITTGSSAQTTILEMWIESASGTKLFGCTWTVSNPSTQLRVTVGTVPA